MQFDWRGYPDWPVAPGSGRLEYETFDVRRLRAGIDGQWRQMSFEVGVDPMDDLDDTLIKDAYVQIRFTRALRLRGGQFKLPGGREYGTSARSLDFLERSAFAQSIAPGRDIGGTLYGQLGRRFAYEAGLFAGDANGRNSRSVLPPPAALLGMAQEMSSWPGRSPKVERRPLIRNRRMVSKDVRSPATGFSNGYTSMVGVRVSAGTRNGRPGAGK